MLKRVFSILTCGLVVLADAAMGQAASAPKAASTQNTVLVRNGAILKFVNVEPIDQGTAKVGDRIPLRLTQALVIDGVTVLPEGQTFSGTVKKVHRKVPNCNSSNGWVEWRLDRISFVDSSTVQSRVLGITKSLDPNNKNWLDIVDEKGIWVDRLDYAEMHGVPKKSHVWENVGIAAVAVPGAVLFAGVILAEAAEYSRCSNAEPGLPPLPAGSTVIVATSDDHRVHY